MKIKTQEEEKKEYVINYVIKKIMNLEDIKIYKSELIEIIEEEYFLINLEKQINSKKDEILKQHCII